MSLKLFTFVLVFLCSISHAQIFNQCGSDQYLEQHYQNE